MGFSVTGTDVLKDIINIYAMKKAMASQQQEVDTLKKGMDQVAGQSIALPDTGRTIDIKI